jgi:uncharacterized damage-inducible protein DinB
VSDELRRIQGYLRAQGAKLEPAAIVDKVRAAMAELHAAARTVPSARWTERPAPEEWSANEVLAHVVSAGRYFGGGIVAILDGARLPARPSREDPAGALARPPAEWERILAADREALFARALAADPGARLEETMEHPAFGPLNWRETLLFMRLHDLDHAGQLGKIAAALA